jgi:hypothetical protein
LVIQEIFWAFWAQKPQDFEIEFPGFWESTTQEINSSWEKYPGNKFQLGKSIQGNNFDWEKYPGK